MLIALWAVAGAIAPLASAVIKLTPRTVEALQWPELGVVHIAFAVIWTGWMVYAEGYRGFQGGFAPRVAARAMHLGRDPNRSLVSVILAPAYAIGLFGARKRTMIVAWTVIVLVVIAVLIVQQMTQPWRGLVDLGVVAGLAYGALSVLWFTVRAARDPEGMSRWLAMPD